MKFPTLLFSFTLAVACTCLAQKTKDTPPEKAAIESIDQAYEKAYAAADYKTLAGLFTDDAEYINEDGRTITGQAAIEQTLRDALRTRKGGRIAITADSVEVLAPGVVLEKGATEVTNRDGEIDRSLFTAVYLKKDGKWKIHHLVESPAPALAHEHLTELAWLIGSWEEADKSSDLTVSSDFTWGRGGNFITRNVTVKRAGEVTLEGWQVIGWDAAEERIRSWTFDTEGGFAEGRWTREGNRWLARETGVTPDGDRTGADNTFSKLSDDRFTFESTNRTLNGEPRPGIGRIEISRVKKEKGE